MKHPGLEDKTAVVVGTRADDNVHVQEVPKLKVCSAHEHPRVEPHPQGRGGKIVTFSQLALDSPKGCNTVLLSGPRKGGEVYGRFRPGNSTATLYPSWDQRFEHAKSQRARHSYKN
eukprot:bmy_11404T0